MKKILLLLCCLAALIGCQGGKVSSRPINLNVEVFPLKEEGLIQAGRYETRPEIYLYLLVDTFDATLLEMMEEERTFSRIANHLTRQVS